MDKTLSTRETQETSKELKENEIDKAVLLQSAKGEESEIRQLPPLKPPAENEHPLQNAWLLWYFRRLPANKTVENFEKNLKIIGEFNTVEGFWQHYSHLLRPNDMPVTSDYHLFRYGIKPMWEVSPENCFSALQTSFQDEANKQGGKWIIRLRKGLASRCWEELVLAIIGEQFDVKNDEICGAVVSIRFQEDIISVWNRNSQDKDAKIRIHERMKAVLHSVPTANMEYKCHDASIKDNSSFRNAEPSQSLIHHKPHSGYSQYNRGHGRGFVERERDVHRDGSFKERPERDFSQRREKDKHHGEDRLEKKEKEFVPRERKQ